MLLGANFILYVRDQSASATFYAKVLALSPRLDVPGMTEFALPGGAVLGLMPEAGIRRLLGSRLPEAPLAQGRAERALRAEVYLVVDSPDAYHQRSLAAGATELSGPSLRDWGHIAAYSLDADGHVIAFASVTGYASERVSHEGG